jgi:hypothetical protein
VPDEVGRELRSDHEIDRPAVAFTQVEQAPGRRVREDLALRIPLERHAHELGQVAARPELPHELADVHLRATVHEGHLGFTDKDRLHDAW